MKTPAARICLRCGEEKPLENFSLSKRGKYGRASRCKPCAVLDVLESRARHRDRYDAYQNSEKEMARKKAWNEAHPDYRREHSARWRKENPEKQRQYRKTWEGKNPDYHPDWRAANRERLKEVHRRFRQRHRQKMTEKGRRWREQNPEKIRHYGRLRRARRRSGGGSFSAQEWNALCDRYNHTCLRCGASAPNVRIVPDHVIPLSLGGANDISNLQPLCAACNGWKYTKIIDYRKDIG